VEQLTFAFRGPRPVRRPLRDPVHQPALREALAARLAPHLPAEPFRLLLTDNTSTVLSARRRLGRLEVRLHHMFLEADLGVLAALARYLCGRADRAACRQLDAFIASRRDRLRKARAGRGPGPAGAVYHLERIRDALGRAYFGGPLAVPIGWGRAGRRGRRRFIQLGAYSFEDGCIRVHPALDQPWVPPAVVVAVVYHELLHHVLGARQAGRRRLLHTREFRERERLYVHHARARAWEAAHLGALLSARGRRKGA